ncbi:MAG TPA: hypothetical protein VJ874_04775 [Candidatus Thermoplasmatota archaeon]|nr:hypothetical protein [Candidatus Thermoplasmatota archaeon]
MGVLDIDVESWEPSTYFFHVLAALYLAAFLVYWVRFQRAEKAAKRGDPGAPERFNELLRGFPNTMFAKMFGKKPYEVPRGEAGREAPPDPERTRVSGR